MILLSPDMLAVDEDVLEEIESTMRKIYRLITYSRKHRADDLLDRYLRSIQRLQELMSIKNAQMEAQSEAEADEYLAHLGEALRFVVGELRQQRDLTSPVDLHRIFRIVSPEAHVRHAHHYRRENVMVGAYLAPEPRRLPGLVEQLFLALPEIPNRVVRAMYLHHELVRIHPFVDGNGRVSRMAKNWMLMYDLKPPTFIRDLDDRRRYLRALEASFRALDIDPDFFGPTTAAFFADELTRLRDNAVAVYEDIRSIGAQQEPGARLAGR